MNIPVFLGSACCLVQVVLLLLIFFRASWTQPYTGVLPMEIMIKSTDELTTIDGVPVRVWRGTTERGAGCLVFVHLIAVAEEQDRSEFQRELKEQLPPAQLARLEDVLRRSAP